MSTSCHCRPPRRESRAPRSLAPERVPVVDLRVLIELCPVRHEGAVEVALAGHVERELLRVRVRERDGGAGLDVDPAVDVERDGAGGEESEAERPRAAYGGFPFAFVREHSGTHG